MPPTTLVQYAREALLLAATLSLPIIGVAAVIGLLVAVFQAASQIQDPTIAHLPRLLGVVLTLVVLGPWLGHGFAAFATRMLMMAAAH
jgi:flagellar biosynthetic protein FliQ